MKTVKGNIWVPSFLEESFPESKLESLNYESFSIPKVNIKENSKNFVIELAAPGLSKESFAIEVEKDILKVSSNGAPIKASTDTSTKIKYTRKEFNYHSFKRSFNVPETVKVTDIEASYKDGILFISLPKKEAKEDIKRMVEIS